jgi:hypothetical protein
MRNASVLVLMLVIGCGRDDGDIDDTIGSRCASDRDCDERCFMGADFPGGFCSLPCLSDNDCPGDTFCIDEGGGSCMFACPGFDCSRLGAGWTCRDEDRISGGSVNVCSGD